jgi:hypothetical protein
MTPEEFETCWVPVPLRWRNVVAGDVIVGQKGKAWHVERPLPDLLMRHGADWWPRTDEDRRLLPDPDSRVPVLTAVPMVNAVELLHSELNAQLLAARSETKGAAA